MVTIIACCAKRSTNFLGQHLGGMARKPNHNISYRVVPELLRQMRDEADLTQRAFAEKIKRPYWWVARCETGSRRLDVTEFMDWCEGCGVDPKNVLDRLRPKA